MKFLWYGTGRYNPKLIYEENDGLDKKFSINGMWGKGLYFSKNASFNLSQSHEHKNRVKGLFFA